MREYSLGELVLPDLLEARAASDGARTFLKFRDGEFTYRDVEAMSARLAGGLAAQGVKRGDHVAVMLPNCPELVHLTFALARLGAVMVPVNPAYKGELLWHVLERSDASLAVVDESCLDPFGAIEEHLTGVRLVIIRSEWDQVGSVNGLQTPWIPFCRTLQDNAADRAPVQYHDLQAIMFTSGTTGPSKGVLVPHAHALTNAYDSVIALDYTPDDTIYCPLPLFHAAALWDGVMSALLAGGAIAIVERFSASRFWTDVRHFNARVAMGVFSMIPILLNRPATPGDKSHPLRAFYLGKSTLDQAFYERFGVRCVETYTSTEVGIATMSPYGHWRPGSCGRVNERTYDVSVVDSVDREVSAGETGELVVRPKRPFVMTQGYYKFPQATADCCRNMWFHTGDRAYRDADGYFYFVDRIKDCIRRRGENISAFEVERTINAHPRVVESAAIAVPSELEEDEIKAVVVLHEGERLSAPELAAFCRERLPSFMVPRYFEFTGVLPKTPTGKVLKHELRQAGEQGITAHTYDVTRQLARS